MIELVDEKDVCIKQDGRSNPRRRFYNLTNTCDKCIEKGRETKLYIGNSYREYNKEGNLTGRWLCKKCWNDDYQKNNSNSIHNLMKSVADHRTGNLDPNCNIAKGDNFEKLTSIWKDVKILSIENDKFSLGLLDHSADSEGIIFQTKGKLYDSYNRFWMCGAKNEWNKEYDYLIFYCASKDGKSIERIYEFPKAEIERKRVSIGIYKDPKDKWGNSVVPWYEKYRIMDEETIKRINEIWKTIINR